MGKLFIALSSFVLAVSAFAAGPKGKAPEVSGTNTDLAGLLNEYVGSGKYVKKSKIYFSDFAKSEMSDYLHAGTNRIEMTTWYDESFEDNGGALLMGDYDGTFNRINSGYATINGKLTHFDTSVPEATSTSDLFNADNMAHKRVDKNTTVNEFYDVLSGLATEVAKGDQVWTCDGTVYSHAISADLDIDSSGNYTDLTMKRFQYFAAPMLLQNVLVDQKEQSSKWLTFSSLKVEEKIGYLSIRIYISASDSGKVTSEVEGDECMLSEAQVYKGHNDVYFAKVDGENAEIGWQTVTDTENNDAELTFVAKAGQSLSMRRGLRDLTFFETADTEHAFAKYGKHVICVNKSNHIYFREPTYGGLLNGKAIEVNDIKTGGTNKAEFEFDLKENDVLELFEGATALHYVHWDDGQKKAIDDGTELSATRYQNVKLYYTTDGVYVDRYLDISFTVVYDVTAAGGGGIFMIHMDGSWDKANLDYRMYWTDGNVWRIDLRLKVGSSYTYKLVRAKWETGDVWSWEGGDNRTLNVTLETPSMNPLSWQE